LGTPALVDDHLKAKRLVAPFERRIRTDFAYFVVCLKERSAEAATKCFIEWLLAEARA